MMYLFYGPIDSLIFVLAFLFMNIVMNYSFVDLREFIYNYINLFLSLVFYSTILRGRLCLPYVSALR